MNGFLGFLWLVVFFSGNPVTLYPAQSDDYIMRLGYYNGSEVWYLPFAASNLRLAKQLDQYAKTKDAGIIETVDFVPGLSCHLTKTYPGDVYLLNCAQNTVFSTEPGQSDYNPIWRAHYLEWQPGLPKIPLTSEADVLAAIGTGDLVEVTPTSILDATIIVPTSGIPSVKFPEEIEWEDPEIELYAFTVHYSNKQTRSRELRHILVTDVSDPVVASALGANYAPTLAQVAPECSGDIYAFINPVPPGQYPIIDQVQQYRAIDQINSNKSYDPILTWTLLQRVTLRPYVVVNNIPYADMLLGLGAISTVTTPTPIVSNSPVTVPELDDGK